MVEAALSGLDTLSPVGRETAQDRVYRQLRTALIRGSFDAGEQFFANDVADRMSVSSMPVREALARLVSERALEATPNRRVRVPLLTQDRARDVARARKLIEGELAGLALLHLTRSDIARLEALTFDYEEENDPNRIADLNHAFHFLIYDRAASPVLMSMAESLWMQAGPFVRAAARTHKPARDYAPTTHHHGILDGIRAGDSALMVSALQADITQAFDILERAPSGIWAQSGAPNT